MRKAITSATHLGFAFCVILAISCSKSTEAGSRREQEKAFREVFGFDPPKAIVEIKYKDVYNRSLMDGAYGQWMRFTYSEELFSRILKEKSYVQGELNDYVQLKSETAPKWWIVAEQNKITLYCRTDKDSVMSEGFRFREFVWHDKDSNLVYFHKICWN